MSFNDLSRLSVTCVTFLTLRRHENGNVANDRRRDRREVASAYKNVNRTARCLGCGAVARRTEANPFPALL